MKKTYLILFFLLIPFQFTYSVKDNKTVISEDVSMFSRASRPSTASISTMSEISEDGSENSFSGSSSYLSNLSARITLPKHWSG